MLATFTTPSLETWWRGWVDVEVHRTSHRQQSRLEHVAASLRFHEKKATPFWKMASWCVIVHYCTLFMITFHFEPSFQGTTKPTKTTATNSENGTTVVLNRKVDDI